MHTRSGPRQLREGRPSGYPRVAGELSLSLLQYNAGLKGD